MTYTEVMTMLKGKKPLAASLRVKLGDGVSVRAADCVVTSLDPATVVKAMTACPELGFRGSPEKGEGQGQSQTARYKGRDFAETLEKHFGITVKGQSKTKSDSSSPQVGTAGANGQLVNV